MLHVFILGVCSFRIDPGILGEGGGIAVPTYIHTYIHTCIHIPYLSRTYFVKRSTQLIEEHQL